MKEMGLWAGKMAGSGEDSGKDVGKTRLQVWKAAG